MAKKLLNSLLFLVFILATSSVYTSCKTAEGCQLEEKYQAKTDKNGNLSQKRGKSNLFSKKQRKRMSSSK